MYLHMCDATPVHLTIPPYFTQQEPHRLPAFWLPPGLVFGEFSPCTRRLQPYTAFSGPQMTHRLGLNPTSERKLIDSLDESQLHAWFQVLGQSFAFSC